MKADYSVDWWRHELNRHIAHFVHNPGDHTQAKLTALITEYRNQSERQRQHAMNYC